jgi:hypothetical protein
VSGWHRLPGFRWLFIVLGTVAALMPLPAVLSPGVSTAARLGFYLPFAVVCAWVVLHVSRCGVKDEADHLVVRNPLRTVRVPWSQVQDFELGRFGVVPKVGVRLRDGSAVGIFGLPIAAGGGDADASTIRLLQVLRSRARAG